MNPKNKNPAGALCASGPMSALFSDSLCSTPYRARRVAVMVMRPMRADGNHREQSR
jgi:hypothetical protein